MTGSFRLAAVGLAAVAALLALAPAAHALEVLLSSDRSRVGVGEQFTVSAEVRHSGMGPVPEPKLPEIENVRQVGSFRSQSFSYVNGRATSSVTIQFVLIADVEGVYTIGPATATKGDETATSEVMTMEVMSASSSATVPRQLGDGAAQSSEGRDLIVLAKVDDDAPYVNEQITYTFTFLRRVRILEGSRYTAPSVTGFWSEDLDTTDPREVTIEGRRYIAERIRTALFPTGDGEFVIGPAQLTTTVEDRSRRRRSDPFDIFGSERFGLFRNGRQVVLQTDAIPVQVRPLPLEGKPADFSGVVGRFELTAEADRAEVQAGDPVTLTVRLSGEGNVKVVPAPDLSVVTDFKIYESESSEETSVRGDRIVGSKTWEYVLVPTVGGDVEIPPVRISVFDPEAERYEVLATRAIPLKVEATDLDQALARGDDPTVAKERVRLRQRDIRYVKPAPGSFGKSGGSPFTSAAFLLAHAIPVLALAGSTLVRRHRDKLRSDVRYARSRQAAKAAAKRLKSSRQGLDSGQLEGFFAELSVGLREYVADKLHLAAANLEEHEVREGLAAAGAPAEEAEELFRMLRACDSARYSGLGGDPEGAAQLFRDATEWIQRLEKR